MRVESKKVSGVENMNMGGIMKKVIKFMGKTTNENLKCHLHIPHFRKGIYVLNIIIQIIIGKRRSEIKGPQGGTPKTLMPLTKVQKPDGSKNPKGNPKRDQVTHLWG
jgi:hypothetical protein